MTTLARLLKLLVRLCGLAALLLGLAFWTGHLFSWLSVHMLLGLVVVLAMWATAALGLAPASGGGPQRLRRSGESVSSCSGECKWVFCRETCIGSFRSHLLAGGVAMGLGTALASAVERSALGGAPGASPRAAAQGSSRRPPQPEVS